jgi:hypothetical protein
MNYDMNKNDNDMNKNDNDYGNITIYDIYQNSIQIIIDIINDITILLNNYNSNTIFTDIYKIIFKTERLFYLGIIFIIISFVIYFIDGVNI